MVRPPLFLAAVVSAALAAGLLAAPPAPDLPSLAAVAVQSPAAKAAPRPLPKGPNKILLHKGGKLVLLDPDGKTATPAFDDLPESPPVEDAKLSPDGTRVAFLRIIPRVEGTPSGSLQRQKLVIRTLGGKGPVIDTEAACHVFAWSADGAKLVACANARAGEGKDFFVWSHFLVDAATGTTTPLKLPSNHLVTGWLPGDKLLTTSIAGTEDAPRLCLHRMSLDGTGEKELTGENARTAFGLPSPDGTRVLCHEYSRPGKDDPPEARRTLVLLDVATAKSTPVDGLPLNGELRGLCWSPDGTKIAYTWRQLHEGTTEERIRKETEWHLVVADPDGRNPRTILSEKVAGQWADGLGSPDWR